MNSGIKADSELQKNFKEMDQPSKCPYDYIVMLIKQIDPDAKPIGKKQPPEGIYAVTRQLAGTCEAKYEGQDLNGVDACYYDMVNHIKTEYKTTPCFIIMYVNYPLRGSTINKLCAISWNPDDASMKSKMKYSTTFDGMVKKIKDLNKKLIFNDFDDMNYDAVVKRICVK